MEQNQDKISLILLSLPEKPGVYQHLNKEGEIIYVGKAKNLKKRVSSYFRKDIESRKTRQLVSNIADIKYIVVESEQDAFLLENNLIKKYQPYYNILLKDGKSYPSICITKEEFPRVYKTRTINKRIGEYYGPYSFGNTVDLVLELIHQLYPIRTCSLPITEKGIRENKYKVCLKYHIKKCCGVCEDYISKEEYNKYIDEIRQIIKGDAHEISESLLKQMRKLSTELKFEDAQKIKLKYDLIEKFRSKTIITNTNVRDTDVFGYIEEGDNIYVSMLKVHRGSIIQGHTIEYRKVIEENSSEILSKAIIELRNKLKSDTKDIIVPFMPDFNEENTNISIPSQGDRKKILDLAMSNVIQYANDKKKQTDKLNPNQRAARILTELQKRLKLKKMPVTIESFDNSNIQGTNAVAGCVVFKMAKPSKKDYKKFIIKTVEGQDDYASMREVVYRRYKRIADENGEFPDLIIADGGTGQMNVIKEAIEDMLNLNIPIAGLVKDSHHRTSSLLYGFPPQEIGLKPTEELFHFLTQIQDEVHRYAISFHRDKRSKAQIHSEIDDIKGVGENTKQKLLKKFKSIERIRTAKLEELEEIVGNARASKVYKHFHNEITE